MQASRRQRRLAKTTGTKTARSPVGLCRCLARLFRTLQAPEPPNRAPRRRPRPSRPRHVVQMPALFDDYERHQLIGISLANDLIAIGESHAYAHTNHHITTQESAALGGGNGARGRRQATVAL